jgi:hypothetical protein
MLVACPPSSGLVDEPVAEIVQCTEPASAHARSRLPGSSVRRAAPAATRGESSLRSQPRKIRKSISCQAISRPNVQVPSAESLYGGVGRAGHSRTESRHASESSATTAFLKVRIPGTQPALPRRPAPRASLSAVVAIISSDEATPPLQCGSEWQPDRRS